MSIVRDPAELERDGIKDACYLCGQKITYPSVLWMGHECQFIVLHPACVLDLFVRLARDLHQLKQEGDGYPFEP